MEKFERKQAPNTPAITIRKNGSICLNGEAAKEFALGDTTHASLFFDKAENTIGIKPTGGTADPTAFNIIREKGRTVVIASQSFLTHFGIPYSQGSKVHLAKWDAKRGMIVVKLT